MTIVNHPTQLYKHEMYTEICDSYSCTHTHAHAHKAVCVLIVMGAVQVPLQERDELQTDVLNRINQHYNASCVFVHNNLLNYIVTFNLTYDCHSVVLTIQLYSYILQVMNRFRYSDRQGCRWLCKKYNK